MWPYLLSSVSNTDILIIEKIHTLLHRCLQTVSPTFCPLCRKPYLPDRIKKLHIDRPDTVTEDRDVDLMQRLCLAWGLGQAPSASFTPLIIEVDAWLKSRTDEEVSFRKQHRRF